MSWPDGGYDVKQAGSLKGKTFNSKNTVGCPSSVEEVLQVDGIESVYAMASMLTISKRPGAKVAAF
eukprot:854087-Rhodomonas_salina.1